MGARKGPTEATSLGTRVAPGPAQPQRMAGVGALPPSPSSPTPVQVAPESYADTRARVAREREDFLKGYKRPDAPKKDCPPGCTPT